MSLFSEIIVDNFAGGGGASTGIEMATGKSVDIAINHDPAAIAMHRANHPESKHYCEDVWQVDPVEACKGRKVALAWFSPDCKHFSKAKGGKPVSKNIRGLAWVAVKWAKLVRPRVIMLENVEEFQTWGPLIGDKPNPKAKGKTFKRFVHALERCGYKVQFRELTACDYGAPTSRKRFFLIARSDGQPIIWPEETCGDPDSLAVRAKILKPWRAASECIDFNVECVSIFERTKPLCENTLYKIANGIKKFVVDDRQRFSYKSAYPFIIQYHGSKSNEARGQSLNRPLMVIDSSNRYSLVMPYMSRDFRADSKTKDVEAFLIKYYGCDIGQSVIHPLHTITTKERFALVKVHGLPYHIVDIRTRMLAPRELFDAQGFPHNYIIDVDADGKEYPKSEQVARCGNAVPPPFAEALTRANLPELCGIRAEMGA